MSDLDAASALAIDGLTFVSQHEVYRDRFLQLSGIEASQIRKAAGEPGFFPGLLDFLLADERTLQAFAEWRAVSPQSVESARRTLTAAYGADSS